MLRDGKKVEAEMMERTSSEFTVSKPFEFTDLLPGQEFRAIAIPYAVSIYCMYSG